ncbi:putative 54S ribosomal protein [Clavispora lusitaniae]|uniref:Uncharacterized protein n=3 Tax=Clavispora lusitaniae TaxID=36911 RepID=C4XVY5_CLAL4|nr:uncharacterized protein CLUG_00108 [Clavispora lusitaniae ATCC 42720]KAF5213465.1 hypothetical protein E0198_000986 [Clavispora lusitaniae]EEQ35985.1 hypothetical protein CLUG_00108 [Clavispora lusitaniae ATCC 42720]KAF7584043.1 Mitochondrial ribosomal protein L27 family protein [Clavispora lusitaniae]OVF06539.1 putative mitochondrial 54S ribosomal protein [Clavispora lusitaniae]QFZ25038.1 putative 54S ribosomal protein [Clavispora lusitaniae]
MRASSVLNFQHSATANLRRPWQTFKDGQIWYGLTTRGSKRHPLTSKQGNKHYYKGTGSSGYGKLNKAGQYIVNWSKVRTYVVPADLPNTELKALVGGSVPQIYQRLEGYSDGFKSPELLWENIKDFVEYGENYNDQDLEKNNYLEEFIHPDVLKAQEEENAVITKD